MIKPGLTKSRILTNRQCPRRLWLKVYRIGRSWSRRSAQAGWPRASRSARWRGGFITMAS